MSNKITYYWKQQCNFNLKSTKKHVKYSNGTDTDTDTDTNTDTDTDTNINIHTNTHTTNNSNNDTILWANGHPNGPVQYTPEGIPEE